MKNFKLAILFLCTLFVSQLQAQDLTIVANTWPPYVDEALPGNGLAMKIVDAVFKQVGYDPKIRIEKWEKALEGSKLGVYDVAGAVWKTDSRKQKLLYSNPYLHNNIIFVARSDKEIKYNKLSDLHGMLIGILNEYAYDEKFIKDPRILKFKANRLTQNLISVQQGKLDLAVADKRLAIYELKHFMGNNRSEFQFLPNNLTTRKLYIAAPIANSQSKTIISKFNQGLAAIKKNGTYQKIIDSYTF